MALLDMLLDNSKTMPDKAILEKNVVLCDKIYKPMTGGIQGIDNQFRIRQCYGRYMLAYPERAVCDKISEYYKDQDHLSKYYKGECLAGLANIINDPSLCLEEDENQYVCVSYIAYHKKDINVCHILPSTDDMNKCFEKSQGLLNEISIASTKVFTDTERISKCLSEKYNDEVDCLAGFAYEKKDASICNNLPTKNKQQVCVLFYQTKIRFSPSQ